MLLLLFWPYRDIWYATATVTLVGGATAEVLYAEA